MITTVTTVTTVTTIVALGITATISIALVATLMVFLAARELASTGLSRFSLCIAKFTSVGILPLAIAFTAIVVMKIVEVL